jgi:hypothetical protein
MFSRLFGLSEEKKRKKEIETKYSLPNFISKINQLQGYQSATESNIDNIVDLLVAITELMLYGDKHNPAFFDVFADKQVLKTLMTLLESCKAKVINEVSENNSNINNDNNNGFYVRKDDYSNHNTQLQRQIIQSTSMLLQNTSNKMTTFYLLSNNLVNQLIVFPYDLENEDVLSTYISFVKTLSNSIDPTTLHFLFNAGSDDFPLLVTPLRWHATNESLIRNFVRTIVLNIFNCKDQQLFFYLAKNIAPLFSTNIIWFVQFQLKAINKWINNIHFKFNLLLFSATSQSGPFQLLAPFFSPSTGPPSTNSSLTPLQLKYDREIKKAFEILFKQEDLTSYRLEELTEQIFDTILFILDFIRSQAMTAPIVLPQGFIEELVVKQTQWCGGSGEKGGMSLNQKVSMLLPVTHYLEHLYIGNPADRKVGTDNGVDCKKIDSGDKNLDLKKKSNGIYLSDVILEQLFHSLILPLLSSLTLFSTPHTKQPLRPSVNSDDLSEMIKLVEGDGSSSVGENNSQKSEAHTLDLQNNGTVYITPNELPDHQYISQSMTYPLGLKTHISDLQTQPLSYSFILYFLTQIFTTFQNAIITPNFYSKLITLKQRSFFNDNSTSASALNSPSSELESLDHVDLSLSRLLDATVVLLFGIIQEEDFNLDEGDEISDQGNDNNNLEEAQNTKTIPLPYFHQLVLSNTNTDPDYPALPFYISNTASDNENTPNDTEKGPSSKPDETNGSANQNYHIHSLLTCDFVISQNIRTLFPSTITMLFSPQMTNQNVNNQLFEQVPLSPISPSLTSNLPLVDHTPARTITTSLSSPIQPPHHNVDQNLLNPRAPLPKPKQYSSLLLSYSNSIQATTTRQLRQPQYSTYRQHVINNYQLNQNHDNLHSLAVFTFFLQNGYKSTQFQTQLGLHPYTSPIFGPYIHSEHADRFYPYGYNHSAQKYPQLDSFVSLVPNPTMKSTQFDEIYVFNDMSSINDPAYPLVTTEQLEPNECCGNISFGVESERGLLNVAQNSIKSQKIMNISLNHLDVPNDIISELSTTPRAGMGADSEHSQPNPSSFNSIRNSSIGNTGSATPPFGSTPHFITTTASTVGSISTSQLTPSGGSQRNSTIFHYNALPSPDTYSKFLSLFTQIHPTLAVKHRNAHIIPNLIKKLAQLGKSSTAPPPLFSSLLLVLQLVKNIYVPADIMSRAHMMFSTVRSSKYTSRDVLQQTTKMHYMTTYHTTRANSDVVYAVYQSAMIVLWKIMTLIGVRVRKNEAINDAPTTNSRPKSTDKPSISGLSSPPHMAKRQQESNVPFGSPVEISFDSELSPLLWFKVINLISIISTQLLNWLLPTQAASNTNTPINSISQSKGSSSLTPQSTTKTLGSAKNSTSSSPMGGSEGQSCGKMLKNLNIYQPPSIYPPILFNSNPMSLFGNLLNSTSHLLFPSQSTATSSFPLFSSISTNINNTVHDTLVDSSTALPHSPIETIFSVEQLATLKTRLSRHVQQTPLHSRPPTSFIYAPVQNPEIQSPSTTRPSTTFSSPYTEQLFTLINTFCSLYILFFLLHSPHILAATRYNKLDLKVYLYDHFMDTLGNTVRTLTPESSQSPKIPTQPTLATPILPLLPSMTLPAPVSVGNVIRVLNRTHSNLGGGVVPHDSYKPSGLLAGQSAQQELPPVYDVTICATSEQQLHSGPIHHSVRLNMGKDTSIPLLSPNHPHNFSLSTALLSSESVTAVTTQQTLSEIQKQFGGAQPKGDHQIDKRRARSDPKKPSPDEIQTSVITTTTSISRDTVHIHSSVSLPQLPSLQPFSGEHGFVPNSNQPQTPTTNQQKDILTVTKCGKYLIIARPLLTHQQQLEANQRNQSNRSAGGHVPTQTSSPCKLLFSIPTMNCHALPYDCIYPTKYMYSRLSEYYQGELDLHISSWSSNSPIKMKEKMGSYDGVDEKDDQNKAMLEGAGKIGNENNAKSGGNNYKDGPPNPEQLTRFSKLSSIPLILKDDYPLLPTDICLVITSPYKPHPAAISLDHVGITTEHESSTFNLPVPIPTPPNRQSVGITSPPGFSVTNTTTFMKTKSFFAGILPDFLSAEFFATSSTHSFLTNFFPKNQNPPQTYNLSSPQFTNHNTGLEHINYDYCGSPCAFNQAYCVNYNSLLDSQQIPLFSLSQSTSAIPGPSPNDSKLTNSSISLNSLPMGSFGKNSGSFFDHNNNSQNNSQNTSQNNISQNSSHLPPSLLQQASMLPILSPDQPIYNNRILNELIQRHYSKKTNFQPCLSCSTFQSICPHCQSLNKPLTFHQQVSLSQTLAQNDSINGLQTQTLGSFTIAHYRFPHVSTSPQATPLSDSLVDPNTNLTGSIVGSSHSVGTDEKTPKLIPSLSSPSLLPVKYDYPVVKKTHYHALTQDLLANTTINSTGLQLLFPSTPPSLTASPNQSQPLVPPSIPQHLIPLSPTQQTQQLWLLPLRCPSGLVAGKVITMINDAHRHAMKDWCVTIGAILAQGVLENCFEQVDMEYYGSDDYRNDDIDQNDQVNCQSQAKSTKFISSSMMYDFSALLNNVSQSTEEEIAVQTTTSSTSHQIDEPARMSNSNSSGYLNHNDDELDEVALAFKNELEEEIKMVEENDRLSRTQSRTPSRRNSLQNSVDSQHNSLNNLSHSSSPVSPNEFINLLEPVPPPMVVLEQSSGKNDGSSAKAPNVPSIKPISAPKIINGLLDLDGIESRRIQELEARVQKERMEESQHVDLLIKKQESLERKEKLFTNILQLGNNVVEKIEDKIKKIDQNNSNDDSDPFAQYENRQYKREKRIVFDSAAMGKAIAMSLEKEQTSLIGPEQSSEAKIEPESDAKRIENATNEVQTEDLLKPTLDVKSPTTSLRTDPDQSELHDSGIIPEQTQTPLDEPPSVKPLSQTDGSNSTLVDAHNSAQTDDVHDQSDTTEKPGEKPKIQNVKQNKAAKKGKRGKK